MGNKIFANLGIDIAALVNEHLSPSLFDATLTKEVEGTRTPGALTAGTNPVLTPFTAKGFIDEEARRSPEEAPGADDGTVTIVLIGDSIANSQVPVSQDLITILGSQYRITGKISADPDHAQFRCVCTPT